MHPNCIQPERHSQCVLCTIMGSNLVFTLSIHRILEIDSLVKLFMRSIEFSMAMRVLGYMH